MEMGVGQPSDCQGVAAERNWKQGEWPRLTSEKRLWEAGDRREVYPLRKISTRYGQNGPFSNNMRNRCVCP